MTIRTKLEVSAVVLLALVAVFTTGTPVVRAEDPTRIAALNESGWPVFIYVDGVSFCYADEGAACTGIASPGSHRLEALVGSDVIASKSITLKRGDTYLWTVREK